MSYTIPAIRGRMGSTEFYQASMTARELAGTAKIAGELEEWTQWSVFERIQRDINLNRVRREIVPYLARSRDRFFGAFIILVFEPDQFDFEPIRPAQEQYNPYAGAAARMGFLTIEGGSLVALDGQHRLVSLREVIKAGNELEGPYLDAVAQDDLCVVFIRHETFEKTRRIFSKVNRHAKPTTTAENISINEDDGYSIVTRWLVEPEPPLGLDGPRPPLGVLDPSGEPIVEWRRGQVTVMSSKFTTLPHLEKTVRSILKVNGFSNFDEKHRVNRPPDDELAAAYRIAAAWWHATIDQFMPYRAAMNNPARIPELRRSESRHRLLFIPVIQEAIFSALASAHKRDIPLETALERLDELPWHPRRSPLNGVLATNGRPKTRSGAIRLGARLLEYLIYGSSWTAPETEELEDDLKKETGQHDYELPAPLG